MRSDRDRVISLPGRRVLPRLAGAGIGVAALALVAACGGAGSTTASGGAETQKFTVVSFTAPDAPEQVTLEWWMDEIEKRSDGAVEFESHPQEALCPGPEITQCVRDGRADFGMTVTGYTPDEFPITEIWSVPFLSSDVQAVTQAHMALYEESESFQQEVANAGLEAFVFFPSDRALLNFNEPITNHDALQGKSVRAVGLAAEALAEVGAKTVAVTASETYEAAQRGVVDGFVMNIAGNATYSLYEVADHWYDAGMGVYAGLGVFGNKDVVADLPEDVRAVFDEVTAEWIEGKGIELITETQQASCDKIVEADTLKVWERWDEAAITAFKNAVGDKPKEAWIAGAQDRGVSDAAQVYERYTELLGEFEDPNRESIVEQCMAQVQGS